MKINGYDHDADNVTDAIKVDPQGLLDFREKAKLFLQAMAEDKSQDVHVYNVNEMDMGRASKSEIYEAAVKTFTVEELAVLTIMNSDCATVALFKNSMRLVEGSLFGEVSAQRVHQERQALSHLKPKKNPFEDLDDKSIF